MVRECLLLFLSPTKHKLDTLLNSYTATFDLTRHRNWMGNKEEREEVIWNETEKVSETAKELAWLAKKLDNSWEN